MIKCSNPIRIIGNELVGRNGGPIIDLEVVAECFWSSKVCQPQVPCFSVHVFEAVAEKLRM